MTSKKIKIVKEESKNKEINLAQTADTAIEKENNSFWKEKTVEELVKEQGVTPVKDEKDFARRFWGGLEDWDDIDEFLKEVHRPWK
jgi:hypothetical protein